MYGGQQPGTARLRWREIYTMSRTPNDDRSDSMNPNNDSYDDAQDNRSDQLNPNNERYQGDDQDD